MNSYLSLNDKNWRRQYVAAMIKNMSIGSSRICHDNVKTPVSELSYINMLCYFIVTCLLMIRIGEDNT